VIDHDVLDRDQDQEDHHPDYVVAADHEISKRFDHLASSAGSGVSVNQDQT